MSKFPLHQTNQSKLFLIATASGFFKPILAMLLFLGLGIGLIILYQPSPSNQMVPYKNFKETKNKYEKEPKALKETSKLSLKTIKERVKPVLDQPSASIKLPLETLQLIQRGMALTEAGKFNSAEI